MEDLTPRFSVHFDPAHNELHFATSGLFDAQSMDAFLAEVTRTVGPVLQKGKRVRALGDLNDYVTQTREIGERMAQILEQAEQNGIEKTAIVINSTILKMQYKRVSEGRNVEIFEDRDTALVWLRGA